MAIFVLLTFISHIIIDAQLDNWFDTSGPRRMRKLMCRHEHFYSVYPYRDGNLKEQVGLAVFRTFKELLKHCYMSTCLRCNVVAYFVVYVAIYLLTCC